MPSARRGGGGLHLRLLGRALARRGGDTPVGDIDLLVLGDPDRSELYATVHEVGLDIGREIQAQIRPPGWLDAGTGSFHDTILNRPMVKVLPFDDQDRNDGASSTARPAS